MLFMTLRARNSFLSENKKHGNCTLMKVDVLNIESEKMTQKKHSILRGTN